MPGKDSRRPRTELDDAMTAALSLGGRCLDMTRDAFPRPAILPNSEFLRLGAASDPHIRDHEAVKMSKGHADLMARVRGARQLGGARHIGASTC
jgi:hypothetical protein